MAELSDNVRKFGQQMSENEELAGKIQEAKSHTEIIALASEMGLEISAEELEVAQAKAMELSVDFGDEELTDEQLEAVAGGAAFFVGFGMVSWATIGVGFAKAGAMAGGMATAAAITKAEASGGW